MSAQTPVPTETDLEAALSTAFGVGGSDDDDLLHFVDKHTLQLDGEQLQELMFLHSLDNPMIDAWIARYLDYKAHVGSVEMVTNVVTAISLRQFIAQFRFNVNTTK